MLRTHKTRPVGGALVVVATLVVCLVVGMLGGTAQADDTTPSDQPSTATPADAGATSSPDTSGQQQTTSAPSGVDSSGAGTVSKLLTALGPNPAIAADPTFVLKRGLTDAANVGANDPCRSQLGNPCHYSKGTIPAGWVVNVTTDGVITVRVPGSTAPRMYHVGYTVTDNNGQTAGVLNVAVTPDNYNPPAGMLFSHPYRKGYRNIIRDHVLRTINSVPSGATIQVASWSFSSKLYRNALKAAMWRGVKVQIVLAWRNKPKNSDWRRLTRSFGTTVVPQASWVKKCWKSCRGVSGTMHSKIFLFSQAYRAADVMISGSANLTDFAVTNQWNQMNTVVGNAPVYDEAVKVFTQMYHDAPVTPQYIETHFPNLTSYYYPHNRVSPDNDFMLKALAPVRCKGAVNAGRNGRTIIKIAMYAWYQNRGKWLAKRVRQLWQQGCQVQIVYAISSNPVKSILYSPAGRGRIPMRQILLANKEGTPIYYLHDKWVSITGNYAGVPDNSVSFQGSFNFADLGFTSDEQFQMLPGRAAYNRFAHDFHLLWTDRQARAPSPVSKIPTIEGRYTEDDLRLGTGVYRYMDAD